MRGYVTALPETAQFISREAPILEPSELQTKDPFLHGFLLRITHANLLGPKRIKSLRYFPSGGGWCQALFWLQTHIFISASSGTILACSGKLGNAFHVVNEEEHLAVALKKWAAVRESAACGSLRQPPESLPAHQPLSPRGDCATSCQPTQERPAFAV